MNEELKATLAILENKSGLITLEICRAILHNTTLEGGQIFRLVRASRDVDNDYAIDFDKLREALWEWDRIETMKYQWMAEYNPEQEDDGESDE